MKMTSREVIAVKTNLKFEIDNLKYEIDNKDIWTTVLNSFWCLHC